MLKQFLFIVSGFFIGQGSMFALQTYLAFRNDFELIASIGIAVGVLSLFQWVSDGGGVFLLSKLSKNTYLINKFLGLLVSRFVFSSVFLFFLFFVLLLFQLNPLVVDVLYFLPIVGLIWMFNITGLIDSYERNKWTGFSSNLSWLFSTIAVLIFFNEERLGLYIGFSFSLGVFITLIIQYYFMSDILIKRKAFKFRKKIIFIFLGKILGYNIAYISSQLYTRLVPLIVQSYIGSNVAGVYIYAKNISNIVSQFVFFSRRVEFANIQKISRDKRISFLGILKAQYLSIIGILTLLVISLAMYVFTLFLESSNASFLSGLVFIQFSLLLFWLVPSSFGQIFLAKGEFSLYGFTLLTTSALSITVIFYSIESYGIYAVILSEFVMLSIQSIIYYFFLKKK